MNSRIYARLTRIVLALSFAIGIIGSAAFYFLKDIIKAMVFSDF